MIRTQKVARDFYFHPRINKKADSLPNHNFLWDHQRTEVASQPIWNWIPNNNHIFQEEIDI